MSKTIRVSETFGPTIQGEGVLIGEPTVFVRTGGCDFRCTWCDSLHAVDNAYRHTWVEVSTEDIFARIEELSGGTPIMVTLSGGNPAIQPFGPLIALGRSKGYRFALETQATQSPAWFSDLDVLVLSPKPPSSEMEFDPAQLASCIASAGTGPRTVFKFVVLDEADFEFARAVSALHPDVQVYLQPCNHTPPPPDDDSAVVDIEGVSERMRWLVERTLTDQWYAARVLPQLHVMLWGNKRGV